MQVDLKPVSFSEPSLLAEPHAFLAHLRATTPVARAIGPSGQSFYLVTSYALVQEASKRNADFNNQIGALLFAGASTSPEVERILRQEDWTSQRGLLVTDEPDHHRYRSLVNVAFSQGRVARLAPAITAIVDELIDAFVTDGECDFVDRFAVLLPTYVIADILGLDRADYPLVRKWSDAVIGLISRMDSPEEEIAAARLVVELRRFIKDTISLRRKHPGDDLVSSLITAHVEGVKPLTDEEIAPIVFEIAVAGNETTRNTLMSGLVRLLRNPEQFQALCEQPSLVENAVEELLRYETPATSMWRVASRHTSLGGIAIPRGAVLLLRFDAANRDPAEFDDPDRFDIRRHNARRHIAFGAWGVHRCLGQMLARKELSIAFPRLLARLGNLRVVEVRSDTNYWPGLLHRGIGELHIAFDPSQPQSGA